MLTKSTMCAWLVAALLAAAAPARAAETTRDGARADAAREVFRAAVEAVQRGDWLEARELYARSYALKPAPTTLYSLAVAQRETGELVEALSHFRAFLSLETSAQLARFREPARHAADELEQRVARVTIVLEPRAAGAVVRLDGKPFPAGRERRANPGVHTVEATAPGYAGKIFSVRLPSGARERLVVELSADEAEDAPGPPPVPLIAVIVGSALLSAGVTTGVVGVAMAMRASDDSDADVARRMGIAGDVMAVTGAVAGGLGVAFWIATPGNGARERATVSLAPGSVALRVDF